MPPFAIGGGIQPTSHPAPQAHGEGSQTCNVWSKAAGVRALAERQTFSRVANAGEELRFLIPDVTRLATFCAPLRG